jgi:O-antigen/teichoic acid export membrane protein
MQIKKIEELKEKAEELLRRRIFWRAVLVFILVFLFLILLALFFSK